jgi:hypothetical protein
LVAAGKVKKAAGAEAITGQTPVIESADLTKVTGERDNLAKALIGSVPLTTSLGMQEVI